MIGAMLATEIVKNPKTWEVARTAVGLAGEDARNLSKTGIPVWVVVLGSALVGGYVALRFAPEGLVRHVRGKRD